MNVVALRKEEMGEEEEEEDVGGRGVREAKARLEFVGRNSRHGRPLDAVHARRVTDRGCVAAGLCLQRILTSFDDGDPGTQMLTEHPSSTIPTVDFAGSGFVEAAFGSSCALWIPAMASSASGEPLGDSRGVPIPSLGVPFADIAPK